MSMLLLPWDVSKMTSGDTPISWPILWVAAISQSVSGFCVGRIRISRVPMLFYCARRVDDGAVHVEEEAMEGSPHGRCRVGHDIRQV